MWRQRRVVVAVLLAWRVSMLAGAMGAIGSACWFTAMAIEPAPPSTPDSFADYIKTEGDRWATIVIKSGAEAG